MPEKVKNCTFSFEENLSINFECLPNKLNDGKEEYFIELFNKNQSKAIYKTVNRHYPFFNIKNMFQEKSLRAAIFAKNRLVKIDVESRKQLLCIYFSRVQVKKRS